MQTSYLFTKLNMVPDHRSTKFPKFGKWSPLYRTGFYVPSGTMFPISMNSELWEVQVDGAISRDVWERICFVRRVDTWNPHAALAYINGCSERAEAALLDAEDDSEAQLIAVECCEYVLAAAATDLTDSGLYFVAAEAARATAITVTAVYHSVAASRDSAIESAAYDAELQRQADWIHREVVLGGGMS